MSVNSNGWSSKLVTNLVAEHTEQNALRLVAAREALLSSTSGNLKLPLTRSLAATNSVSHERFQSSVKSDAFRRVYRSSFVLQKQI